MAPHIGMIASVAIAVKVRSWIVATTVCSLLPTDSVEQNTCLQNRVNIIEVNFIGIS